MPKIEFLNSQALSDFEIAKVNGQIPEITKGKLAAERLDRIKELFEEYTDPDTGKADRPHIWAEIDIELRTLTLLK
ncbi:hypothetical protein [Pseudoxanthomonas mexicana]|uniref:hypothetical protein n=1 Tax=Pseudoxanthomonas mexicana TaxID=128785 RepID=UPI0022F3C206|nr:hypothetical protein [Pseudoxanthomonas mexicana]WBX94983.1 hypothetical protein PE064_07305 [Pseudoxanthomonas mexicana]